MKKLNRLADEKSPYLLQHAENPVDWYPWSDEAFIKAVKEDKPIFLSIGYSTCHWCHVMEKESFEDSEIAGILNKNFINIKVDREERPDIDAFYMNVCQTLSGNGGWPLTILMMPNKKPFFAGTYFPRLSRGNRPGLIDILSSVDDYWKNNRGEVLQSANEILKQVEENSRYTKEENNFDNNIAVEAFNWYYEKFDNKYGGFGNKPKFPSPHNLLFLLRHFNNTGDNNALMMVEKTLLNMRNGGIFDQAGFGFHRYSTDEMWLVPHFEKMLYDQAMLAMVYIELFQITKNEFYKKVTKEIFEYVEQKMTSPEGGFYSSEDADSEGVEGKFYVWKLEELKENLDEENFLLACNYFNMKAEGNWTDPFHTDEEPTNILHVNSNFSAEPEEIETIRKILFNVREKRVHPFKDEKIMTDWNSLMISAYAKAGFVFDNLHYTKIAENAIVFILKNMMDEKEILLHRYKDGIAGIPAFADDYAFLINALIDVYEVTFNPEYLLKAIEFCENFIDKFWDNREGGFFNSSSEIDLPFNQKEVYDGAIPSSNSMAALALLKIFKITGVDYYREKAEELFDVFSRTVKRAPMAYAMFLCGIDFYLNNSFEIIIGKGNDAKEDEYLRSIKKKFIPNRVVLLNDGGEILSAINSFMPKRKPLDNKTTVYICKNFECLKPVNNLEEMEIVLDSITKHS